MIHRRLEGTKYRPGIEWMYLKGYYFGLFLVTKKHRFGFRYRWGLGVIYTYVNYAKRREPWCKTTATVK